MKLNSKKMKLTGVGIIAAGVIAGVTWLPDFHGGQGSGQDNQETSRAYAAGIDLNIRMSGSGGVAEDDNILKANPLSTISGASVVGTTGNAGSGLLLWLSFENIKNPAEASFDICYVTAARTATGSHPCIFENTPTATGAIMVKVLSGSTMAALIESGMIWNGELLLKAATTTDPTDSFQARIRGKLHDIAGE